MQITTTLTEKTAAFLKLKYERPNPGAREAIEGFAEIYRRTVLELKGKFTKPEIMALVDNLNSTLLVIDYQAQPQFLWANLEDGEAFEGLFKKWDVDGAALKSKIFALTAAQTFVLQDEIKAAWNNPEEVENNFSNLLNKFV